jgi:hypothetical protein
VAVASRPEKRKKRRREEEEKARKKEEEVIMDPGDGLHIYACRRCHRNLTNQSDETQWHWDNFRQNVKLFWEEHGRVNASGILCIQCMNVEATGYKHEAPDEQNWPWTGKGAQAKQKGGKGKKKGAGRGNEPRNPDQQGKRKGKGKGGGEAATEPTTPPEAHIGRNDDQ